MTSTPESEERISTAAEELIELGPPGRERRTVVCGNFAFMGDDFPAAW